MNVRLTILALAFLLLPAHVVRPDPARDLRSPDFKARIDAVEALRRDGGRNVEKLLVGALTDRDWEVVEHAATALGERGDKSAVKALTTLAVVGPVRRIRIAAARSLAKLDAASAGATLLRRVVGDFVEPACEALEILAPDLTPEQMREALARGMNAKLPLQRAAAARLVGRFRGRDRRTALDQTLSVPECSVRAAVLDSIRAHPDDGDIPRILELVHSGDLPDVLSRRALAALVAIVGTQEPGESADRLGRRALVGAELSAHPQASARFARLAGMLAAERIEVKEIDGQETEVPWRLVGHETVAPALAFALGHESDLARAAAVVALGRIRTKEHLDRAAVLAATDPSPRVRLHALRAVLGTRTVTHEGTMRLAMDRVEHDLDAVVREEAATALSARGEVRAREALVKALEDEAWMVAVCAAVSLGKTGDPGAGAPLRELLSHRDWKLRAAALTGLGHLREKSAVPDLIEALGARTASERASAYGFLRKMTSRTIPPQVKLWREWWKEVGPAYEFPDLEKEAREAQKYGYATTYKGIYEDLDVIVLQSRGDSIEKLLERLTIAHRLTTQGQVESAGVHPFAVFVSNCTGEINPTDVEHLQWFVRAGGYLFCSCWALHHTVERVCPGPVRKLPTPGQVLENVHAEPCPTESPYLDGVFADGSTRPIYVLYGAHLIEVLDPERVEVLIDSPDCADRWGEGNLACWFTAGHGVILDSANHFDLQGLEKAEGLKGADGRKGYAMDHMGLTYADIRELEKQRIWSSQARAAAEAKDLSAFRFITNFVRQKRRVDR